ncbi:response regulator transcription factor [Azotosporobacter soli]|uniref:response regulator transcription factor n=1 Tax=Azotosporobacter soli TaxID=3055040 RepID=UPI0031FEDC3D
MWKVLIADDEPKIRRGIKSLPDWSLLGLEVAAEAEDGEMALEAAREVRPDIILADICMPFMNGLQFIEAIKKELPEAQIIVITGHDEFSYAQQALKLQVMDYLLKPVGQEQLEEVLKAACEKLAAQRSVGQYLTLANQETQKNLTALRNTFFAEWAGGRVAEAELAGRMRFLKIMTPAAAGLVTVKAIDRHTCGRTQREWEKELVLFAVRNIMLDVLQAWQPSLFQGEKGVVSALVDIHSDQEWETLAEQLQGALERYGKQTVFVCRKRLATLNELPDAYHAALEEMKKAESYTPTVLLSKKYIEKHYRREGLSLQDVADAMQISPTYLSRLLKCEMGVSFIDYLIEVRMRKAMKLLCNPELKLYEIAAEVGYSNQHYFSTAFKKVAGLSPAEYRKRSNVK